METNQNITKFNYYTAEARPTFTNEFLVCRDGMPDVEWHQAHDQAARKAYLQATAKNAGMTLLHGLTGALNAFGEYCDNINRQVVE